HISRGSGNGSRGCRESGAGDVRDESSFFGDIDAGSFLGQCLIDGAGTEPDFVSYVEELFLATEIAGIRERACALEFRRPGENPLESLSVEQRLPCGERRLLIGHAELYLLKSPRVPHRAGEGARPGSCRATQTPRCTSRRG